MVLRDSMGSRYNKLASAAHNTRKPCATCRRRFGQMLNHSHQEVIRGFHVLHGLSPDAVDAVHYNVVGRPRIKVSVPIIEGALLLTLFDGAVSLDHLCFKAIVVISLPTRNL